MSQDDAYYHIHQNDPTIPSCVSLFVLYPILRKSHSGAKSAFDDPRFKALERFLNPCNRPPPREYELLYFTVQHLKFSLWWISLYDVILSKRQKITQKSFLIHPCDFTIHVIANHRGNMSCCTVLHLKFILFVVFFLRCDPVGLPEIQTNIFLNPFDLLACQIFL